MFRGYATNFKDTWVTLHLHFRCPMPQQREIGFLYGISLGANQRAGNCVLNKVYDCQSADYTLDNPYHNYMQTLVTLSYFIIRNLYS